MQELEHGPPRPRSVPPWSPSMSDGCTNAPDAGWWGVHRECCLEHDRVYYYGGNRVDRLDADRALFSCLLVRGMPAPIAWLYFRAVRVFGHPCRRRAGVSWAWGGRRFKYSRRPASRGRPSIESTF